MMIVAVFLGWLSAAIINYIADVLPLERRLITSKCLHCGSEVAFSRYFTFSECRKCTFAFPARNSILTVALVITFLVYSAVKQQSTLDMLLGLLVMAYFACIIVIDIEHRLILHSTSIVGAALMLIIGADAHGLVPTLIGGAVGLIVMIVLFLIGIWFSRLISKSRAQTVDEGLGFGDVTLSGVCGLLLGWPGISIGLFIGILLGGIFSLIILISSALRKQYTPFKAIPYGPFLAFSAIILWWIR